MVEVAVQRASDRDACAAHAIGARVQHSPTVQLLIGCFPPPSPVCNQLLFLSSSGSAAKDPLRRQDITQKFYVSKAASITNQRLTLNGPEFNSRLALPPRRAHKKGAHFPVSWAAYRVFRRRPIVRRPIQCRARFCSAGYSSCRAGPTQWDAPASTCRHPIVLVVMRPRPLTL